MSEVYPLDDEMVGDPSDLSERLKFITPKTWINRLIPQKIVMCIKGQSFSGKSTLGLSASHLTLKHIDNDFKGIDKELKEEFKEFLSEYIPFTPIWVLGTEESTYEALTSEDNAEYFSHADIRYVELLEKSKGKFGTTLINYFKTYKNFLIVFYSLMNQTRGTVYLDSSSTILACQHEVIRRIVGKVPQLAKTQGVLPHYWFWRNAEREGIMFYFRMLKMNAIFTIKEILQSKEGERDFLKVRWWEETDRHLSSYIIKTEQIGNGQKFRSTIEKCRKLLAMYGKTYENLSLPLFMYNLFLETKKIRNNIKKEKRM